MPEIMYTAGPAITPRRFSIRMPRDARNRSPGLSLPRPRRCSSTPVACLPSERPAGFYARGVRRTPTGSSPRGCPTRAWPPARWKLVGPSLLRSVVNSSSASPVLPAVCHRPAQPESYLFGQLLGSDCFLMCQPVWLARHSSACGVSLNSTRCSPAKRSSAVRTSAGVT